MQPYRRIRPWEPTKRRHHQLPWKNFYCKVLAKGAGNSTDRQRCGKCGNSASSRKVRRGRRNSSGNRDCTGSTAGTDGNRISRTGKQKTEEGKGNGKKFSEYLEERKLKNTEVIRVSSETHKRLKQIAMATGLGMHNIANNILDDVLTCHSKEIQAILKSIWTVDSTFGKTNIDHSGRIGFLPLFRNKTCTIFIYTFNSAICLRNSSLSSREAASFLETQHG